MTGTVAVRILVFYIVSQPSAAADGAQAIMGGIAWVFTGIITFFQNLA